MDHDPAKWGHPKFDHLIRTDKSLCTTHTTSPIVTGTSVLAVVYNQGVLLAADCLASYGSLARFRDMKRVNQLNGRCIIGSSGDVSDMQYIIQELQGEARREQCLADGHELEPQQWHALLQSIQYQRRTKMDPLWNAHIVAGVGADGKGFLGFVDLKGTSFRGLSMATGFGAHLAQPLLRDAVERAGAHGLEEGEVVKLLEECMRVLYCRDARSFDLIQMAKVSSVEGRVESMISEPYKIECNWAIA